MSIFKDPDEQAVVKRGESVVDSTNITPIKRSKSPNLLLMSPVNMEDLNMKDLNISSDEVVPSNVLRGEIPEFPECTTLNDKQSNIQHVIDVSIPFSGPRDGQDWQEYGDILYKTMIFDPELNWELSLSGFVICGNSKEDLCDITAFKMHVDIDLMNAEGEKQTLHFSTVLRPYPGCLLTDSIMEYTEVLKIFKIDSFRLKLTPEGVVLPSLSGFIIQTGIIARFGKCPSCVICRE